MLSCENTSSEFQNQLKTSALIEKEIVLFYIYYDILAPIIGFCLGIIALICVSILQKITR